MATHNVLDFIMLSTSQKNDFLSFLPTACEPEVNCAHTLNVKHKMDSKLKECKSAKKDEGERSAGQMAQSIRSCGRN